MDHHHGNPFKGKNDHHKKSYHKSCPNSDSEEEYHKHHSNHKSKTEQLKQNTKEIENLHLKVAELASLIDKLVSHNKETEVELSSLRYYFSNEWKEHVKKMANSGPKGRFNEV